MNLSNSLANLPSFLKEEHGVNPVPTLLCNQSEEMDLFRGERIISSAFIQKSLIHVKQISNARHLCKK